MSLRFIYGRSGSGKTRFCLDEIRIKIAEGAKQPLVLLVPEQYTFQAERDLISVLETGGILKTEVLSFRRLAFRVFNEAGGITYPHINSAGKCMIIYRILDKMRSSFKIFARSADRQGFVNKLAALITEFKRYNITPDTIEEACKVLLENNPLKEKLTELNYIFSAFEKALVERYRDSDDDLTLSARKLASTDLYDGAEIWIDGFAGFTPQEYKIIAQLLQKTHRVNISLCTDCLEDDGNTACTDVFSAVKAVYSKFVKIALEYAVKIDESVILDGVTPFRFSCSPELSHLERNFFAYPYAVYRDKTKDISLFSAANTFSEIEAAARDIIKLCRDEGMRYRDIAVVTGNLATYEKLIGVIFAEYDIPCFIDRKVDISNHPLVRLIMSMLDIFNENWSYESVFRYLKTGLTGIERDSVDRLENYVLACGIRGNRWTNSQDWHMSLELIPEVRHEDNLDESLEEINGIRYEVTRPLLGFRSKTLGKRTAPEICSALYEFLCELGVHERIETIIGQFRERGLLSLANEYSQVWNIVMEVFDQIVEVMGDETFGIERFSNILKIGLGEYRIGLIPASLDQVLVGSVERSRSHEIKALFILGVNDGVFPSLAVEEGVLSDRDRAALNSAGIELASDTRAKAFDDQYLIYRALTMAGRRLRISWPIADHEGKPLRPSMIIKRIRKIFPNISETSDIIEQLSRVVDAVDVVDAKSLIGRTPTFKAMVSALRQRADGRNIGPLWREVYRWFSNQESWKQKCRSVHAALMYKNLAQPVGRDRITALYGDPAWSSVSRLEKFTACPFAYYVQYGLGARERRVYRLRPPDVGTFMHTAIERFSEMITGGEAGPSGVPLSWRSFDREWCNRKVSDIIEEMLDKMKGSGIAASKRYTALAVRLKRVVSRAVWLIAEHIRRSSFNPVGYEIDFGDGGKYPPIVIELDSGKKVYLTGRIDRVDALETENGTYLRIVDYKSGYKDFKLSDVFHGLQIQLITYLDAIWENSSLNAASRTLPGGILYFRIDDPIIKKDGRIIGTKDDGIIGAEDGGIIGAEDDEIIGTKDGGIIEKEIEQAIMKQLKMRGLLLADVRLIKEMDRSIEGTSLIIPATLNKGEAIGKNTSAASLEQFGMLRKYVRKLLKELCEEVMKGDVSISPYKNKQTTSCKYCSFSSICQFDTAMKENSFKLLHDIENEEVWKLIAGVKEKPVSGPGGDGADA